eukprot:4701706-Amphidinium_carterae.1
MVRTLLKCVRIFKIHDFALLQGLRGIRPYVKVCIMSRKKPGKAEIPEQPAPDGRRHKSTAMRHKNRYAIS